MKNFCFIIIFIANFFISKAQQQNDSLTQKLDEYLISANKFYKLNGSALVAQQHSTDTNITTGYKKLNATEQIVASADRWDSTVTYAAGAIWSTTGNMYNGQRNC